MRRPQATRPKQGPELPLLPRVFAVAAAVLLVGSVALAALLPDGTSLGQFLHMIDASAPRHLQAVVVQVLGHGVTAALLVPFLVRPAWLVPVCLGVICAGGAVTAMTQVSTRTKQRRS